MVASAFLVFSYHGEMSYIIHSHRHDNDVTRGFIDIPCNDGAITLEMDFITAIHLLAILTKSCDEFRLFLLLESLELLID